MSTVLETNKSPELSLRADDLAISDRPLKGCDFIPCANLATAYYYVQQLKNGETVEEGWVSPQRKDDYCIEGMWFVNRLN